ncbi:MAG: hypothetical protein II404_12710 [Prevotella sp.]|nr:hypothetical protein [Prevotella sp.]
MRRWLRVVLFIGAVGWFVSCSTDDDWYTLFGVEPSDKLYIKPEDRVKIW